VVVAGDVVVVVFNELGAVPSVIGVSAIEDGVLDSGVATVIVPS
jgi:hypothetical protein